MNKKLKPGDLAYYKRQDISENTLVVVLKSMFFDNSGVEYFKCLIDGRIETICDVWLRKEISK